MGDISNSCRYRRNYLLGKWKHEKGFVPTEDRGIIFTDVQLPPGASMERTYNVLKTLQKNALQIPGIQNVTISTGRGLLSGNGSNNGLAFCKA